VGQPAARQNDQVTGIDTHLCVPPSGPPVPTPLPFVSLLATALSTDVFINGLPAATQDSISNHTPPHIPPPPMTFSKPPTNQGRVLVGSQTVLVNNKPLARVGDAVMTCNDPVDAPVGTIASGSPDVLVG
jgi:uncharacterized Zn-binding protein involved in type VI secretion